MYSNLPDATHPVPVTLIWAWSDFELFLCGIYSSLNHMK